MEILSNEEMYVTLSVDPSASVRDALRNPTFNLSTDIFDKKLNKIPYFDLIYQYIINNNLQNVIVEFALFNTEVGIKKQNIVVYGVKNTLLKSDLKRSIRLKECFFCHSVTGMSFS